MVIRGSLATSATDLAKKTGVYFPKTTTPTPTPTTPTPTAMIIPVDEPPVVAGAETGGGAAGEGAAGGGVGVHSGAKL